MRYAGLILLAAVLVGCQGMQSDKPPIHLNPNMDSQAKYKPQAYSDFFVNSSTMRVPVEGTVARGDLHVDDAFFTGKDADGTEVTKNPLNITAQVLARGQQRYNIYCTPCHDSNGTGNGLVKKKITFQLPNMNFHEQVVKDYADGYIFNVITNGKNNMQPYRHQIQVKDRWAIVAYVRALQQNMAIANQDLLEE